MKRDAMSRHTSAAGATRPAPSKLVQRQLQEQLLHLSTPAFEQLLVHLLTACGYQEVKRLRGRGGADLRATTIIGLSHSTTLVQAKQYQRPVSRRFVDELRGAMLRKGAQQGLLITTSTFFGPAQVAASQEPLPIRLIEGAELLELLLTHRIGVEERPSAKKHPYARWQLNAAFWNQLQQESDPTRLRLASQPTPRLKPKRPQTPLRDEAVPLRRSWCDWCRRLWLLNTPGTPQDNETRHTSRNRKEGP